MDCVHVGVKFIGPLPVFLRSFSVPAARKSPRPPRADLTAAAGCDSDNGGSENGPALRLMTDVRYDFTAGLPAIASATCLSSLSFSIGFSTNAYGFGIAAWSRPKRSLNRVTPLRMITGTPASALFLVRKR